VRQSPPGLEKTVHRMILTVLLSAILSSPALTAPTALAQTGPVQRDCACSQQMDACMAGCESDHITFYGADIRTPRAMNCATLCSLDYAGCLMLQFRQEA